MSFIPSATFNNVDLLGNDVTLIHQEGTGTFWINSDRGILKLGGTGTDVHIDGTIYFDGYQFGFSGSTGPTGYIGPTGPMGNVANTGSTGPTGSIGIQGPTGSQGNTGSQGIQGDIGQTGSTGATGPQGQISSYIFDGGDPFSNYSVGPAFDCGGVV